MADTLFYIFSALTLLCGLLVVFNPFSRNPVTSAMFLVLTIISLSGLFVLLQAYFLAAVQILVYAGAVIVLFLFVIMLLDLKEAEQRRYRKFATGIGALAVLGLAFVIAGTLGGAQPLASETIAGETADLGKLLFTEYLLPFEIVSVLLLVAMVGCILLSKREEAPE
ncbi:MAG: NADH-ubiquinone/plastoquinone oxidoreductase chain 6 [Planctomycetaceae bacterium]|nr:NADH-ubiquinone/plastoquinone oxidoreductase chain 6 [Planctomycetaceae bacterium]|tara:strand:- start:3935 stop:4435 length:501 start_codon:yes stop_codon:yes gene_type:complete